MMSLSRLLGSFGGIAMLTTWLMGTANGPQREFFFLYGICVFLFSFILFLYLQGYLVG